MALLELTARTAERQDGENDGRDCVFCPCRPFVSYCGRFGDSPLFFEDITRDDCRECYRRWRKTGCPNCGCVRDGTCRLCEHGWS